MKNTIPVVMAVCLAFVAGAWAQDASGNANLVQTLYKQGVTALEEGNAVLARQSFQEVLRLKPSHINARIQLDRLKNRSGELAALKRQNRLKTVKIPKVDYDEVDLAEALEALSTVIEQETKGSFVPNFIVRDSAGYFKNRLISLRLRNVPASVVLKHLLGSANARARYDEYAIVISPIGSREAQGQ